MSLLGFAEHEGFRCGTCTPNKPYDILCDRVIDIWEIPLAAYDKNGIGVSGREIIRLWEL